MRPLSRIEKLLLPTATLSALLGLLFAPTSSTSASLGTATVCAAETCKEDATVDCITEQGIIENHRAVPPQN